MTTNWALEIFRVVATGVLALAGAYIGFKLANLGRQHELLYREQYVAFKALAEFLFEFLQAVDEARTRVALESMYLTPNSVELADVERLEQACTAVLEHTRKAGKMTLYLYLMPIPAREAYLQISVRSGWWRPG